MEFSYAAARHKAESPLCSLSNPANACSNMSNETESNSAAVIPAKPGSRSCASASKFNVNATVSIRLLSLFALTGWVNYAVAGLCTDYVGKTVSPMSFDSVEKLMSDIPLEKGEFETTAEFEEKIKKASTELPENFLIGYELQKDLRYDADNQAMLVPSFALDSINVRYDIMKHEFFADVKFAPKIDIVISETVHPTKTYTATNSLGAEVEVVRATRIAKVVFERKASSLLETTFENESDSTLGAIPMKVADAKRLKSSGTGAVLIFPKPPFLAKGTGHHPPNFQSPFEWDYETSVIVADIQCAFVLDGENKVVGAYAVR